ncbi:MAG: hypothetical protein KBD83_04910 [Gammaproteobacteria bacterium]|nr:hypothetical protein [Gammaproteobacteria bacterium]
MPRPTKRAFTETFSANVDSQGYQYSQQGLIEKAVAAHWGLRKLQIKDSKRPINPASILDAKIKKHEVDQKIASYIKTLSPEARETFVSKLNKAINNKISAETHPARQYFSIFHRQVLGQVGNPPAMSAAPR